MSDVVFRKGERVLLRPLERADVPSLRRWMNDPDVTKFLSRVFPMMEKEEEEWVDSLSKRTGDFVFGIVEVEGRKLIGSMGLHGISWHNRTATTGAALGEKEYWGKGYGTEAKMLLLDFAFNALDLYAILSRVYDFNGRSIAYSKKCGYEEVARIPKWHRGKDGNRYDEVLLVVTQEKWRPLWLSYREENKMS